jgi:hypothetical protein
MSVRTFLDMSLARQARIGGLGSDFQDCTFSGNWNYERNQPNGAFCDYSESPNVSPLSHFQAADAKRTGAEDR